MGDARDNLINKLAPRERVVFGFVQREYSASMRTRRSVESNLSRHSEMDRKATFIEVDDDKFPVAPNVFDAPARKHSRNVLVGMTDDPGLQDFDANDVPSSQSRR